MITVRPAAVQELKRLIAKRPNQGSRIRLQLLSGGCAEWTYVIKLDESPQQDDFVFDCQGLALAVPKDCLRYLQGLTMDYSEDLMGGGFRFVNPLAVQTCGCGNSFSTTQADVPLSMTDCTV
jgi:iron-sulfur cluster assembly protein